jgi:hypothetical protein
MGAAPALRCLEDTVSRIVENTVSRGRRRAPGLRRRLGRRRPRYDPGVREPRRRAGPGAPEAERERGLGGGRRRELRAANY